MSGETALNLIGYDLTSLPDSIAEMTQLQNLLLAKNHLTVLPECIRTLIHLQELGLSENNLTMLPDWIGELTQLHRLSLHNNEFSELPSSLRQLKRLQKLYLGENNLTMLPDWIGELTQLQWLYLFRNKFSEFPPSLRKLTQLEILQLDENGLKALPGWIGEFTELRELYLAENNLTFLPGAVGQLKQLETLDLSDNQLKMLPKSIGQSVQPRRLFLHGNEALGLPPEVLGPTFAEVINNRADPANPTDILEYYFRLRGGRRPLNEAKLILVGFGEVGKTSLVNRLLHGRFDPNEKKTPGIKITQWPIQLHGEEEVRLNVWDFGGQEIMHSTHQFFLTERSLYLLVLNGRQGREDADAEYWLSLIESFGKSSPVLVVLNKVKAHPFDVNRRALQQKFPNIRDFIKTDCEDGTGLDALREAIERETDQMAHLRDAFPAAWFSIKDQMARMEENYVSFERFRGICAENEEADPDAQDLLAIYLHNLGIALNYKDDPRLRDVHVLNPHWVTNGIYKLINADDLEAQQGELRLNDLPHILDPADYPRDRHYFLLELMRKFELCFLFPEAFDRYLVPELLDKQQPEEAGAFKPDECLNFQYHYPVLPEGLLPRFIVRTNVLSTEQPRWRTGVILQFEGNRALVKADVQDKKVFVSVAGPLAGRRRLLAIIRSDFDRIHGSFTFKPQEMVPVPGHPDVLMAYQELLVLEQSGLKEVPKVVGSKVIQLKVQDLLNGVDLEGTRRPSHAHDAQSDALQVFFSYSHKDEALRNELESHLKIFQRQGLIRPWHDGRIVPGEAWEPAIYDKLERADIILLLISADFINSDFCFDTEMTRALARHDTDEARVIPILVRDCKWRKAPFARIQSLPKDPQTQKLTPVTLWPNRDTAWRTVADGIELAINALRDGRRGKR